MPEYQFANRDGSIVTEDYDRNTYFSAKQVLKSLKDAFQLFPDKLCAQLAVSSGTPPAAERRVGY